MSVEVERLTKLYGAVPVIRDLTTAFPRGQISVLLGPSGCGKTTTLRCIAGLEQPSSGTIRIDGAPVFDAGRSSVNLPPEKRDLGMVFQSYAIWPHMTVYENVALPLRTKRLPATEVKTRVEETLALVGLAHLRDRGATQLSGGQQQRVAIARCVASRPRLMLLDEPLSNLDAKLRVEMRRELKDLQRLSNATMLFVTHDQEEAMSLADTIFLFSGGAIAQQAKPDEIYRRPVSRYVAEFLGKANIFDVEIACADGIATVRAASGGHVIARAGGAQGRVGPASVLVRPEGWTLRPYVENGGLPGRVLSRMYLGDRIEFSVDTPIGAQTVMCPGFETGISPGLQVVLETALDRIHVFSEPQ